MGSKKRTSSRKTMTDETRIARKPPTPKAAKTGAAPAAAPKAKAAKPPGVKAQIAVLLSAGGSYTVAELVEATGGKEVSVRTALSDLRSEKYCGPTGRLNIVQVSGTYRLQAEAHNRAADEVRKEETRS